MCVCHYYVSALLLNPCVYCIIGSLHIYLCLFHFSSQNNTLNLQPLNAARNNMWLMVLQLVCGIQNIWDRQTF